ncbi:type VI secretion system Vgr family protein [Sphingomonas jatrophae]|uniref:Type VI secretion system secreted protein VgrG n=1 Tax=Sphingomonas jatrophae TaxID=1166337 RepID=A0A1I6LJV3_9SPHN|nr:type VI secretion system tip protein TssI/VgrG [Sphingomonas jatrophae]SFS03807.1 type VI secretion system secreted protein VgrG [Sphingomonas jatrophae]
MADRQSSFSSQSGGGERQAKLAINLGGEQILLERVEAVESFGRPFSISVDLISELGEIDLLPHLGKAACVTIKQDDDQLQRHFHGLIAEGEFLNEEEGHHYRLALRPFTHFMSHNRNFMIHYNKSAIDIIKALVAQAGFSANLEVRAAGSGLVREYCTQYGESDFTFISRLMEEEGLYYFYSHSPGGHKMVICEKPADHQAGKATPLTYNSASAHVLHADSAARTALGSEKYVQRLHERVSTGAETKVTLRDWDFEKPGQPLTQVADAKETSAAPVAEVYEWPGPYIQPAHGKRLAEAILDGRRAEQVLYTAESQLPLLEIGTKVKIASHPNERYNRELLITRTHHVLVTETYRSGSGGGDQGVVFEAVPVEAKWRAPQFTPRPVVRGPETAIVIGPERETIHTDKYGRVQVRFHWDRSGDPVSKMTCWLRVSQTGGLGNIILPRVGHEVIVDFLDGDPDRPLVVGRVFNQQHMPIYALPGNKTRAVWRTQTYTSAGGADDVGAAKPLDTKNPSANEIRFEDMVGKEELFVHAQRDLATRVRRNETHNVGLDQTSEIHGGRTTTIDNNDKLTVNQSQTVKVTNTIEIEAGTSITLKVAGNSIVIDQTGIKLKGIMIDEKADAMMSQQAPMMTIKGDAMVDVDGGLIMLN